MLEYDGSHYDISIIENDISTHMDPECVTIIFFSK